MEAAEASMQAVKASMEAKEVSRKLPSTSSTGKTNSAGDRAGGFAASPDSGVGVPFEEPMFFPRVFHTPARVEILVGRLIRGG